MLTQHQTNEFRAILKQRFMEERERIRQALLQSDQQSHAELAGQVHDSEEAALADLLVDVALADIDRHVGEIRAIDAALLRIAQGGYGVCTECGEAIDIQRLQAAPTVQRCVPCQTRFEHGDRTEHHRSL
jgi:RNA polymerase-binding protein DksA